MKTEIQQGPHGARIVLIPENEAEIATVKALHLMVARPCRITGGNFEYMQPEVKFFVNEIGSED